MKHYVYYKHTGCKLKLHPLGTVTPQKGTHRTERHTAVTETQPLPTSTAEQKQDVERAGLSRPPDRAEAVHLLWNIVWRCLLRLNTHTLQPSKPAPQGSPSRNGHFCSPKTSMRISQEHYLEQPEHANHPEAHVQKKR